MDLDWRSIAVRMDKSVYECCRCGTTDYLTDEERDALLAAIAEERETAAAG
jgi:hypothetical protein